MSQVTFDHDTLAFPLEGQHEVIDCRDCHNSLVFSEVKKECASCHRDIHQQTVGTDCARCHNSKSWIIDDISGIHERISFPLMGVHAQANCYDCHISDSELRFEPIGTECIACHLEDYNNTTQPDHSRVGFSQDCSECHSITGFDWNTDQVNHDFFPLTKGHDIEDCTACHDPNNYSNIDANCFSCHNEDYNNTSLPDHRAANISTNCMDCHTTDPGWMPADFLPHDQQYFPIYSGEHKGEWAECVDCHTSPNNFAVFDCIICHTNPETNEEHEGVSGYVYVNEACLACHPTGSAEENFDHNQTAFPLTGAHTMTECLECHGGGFAGTPTDCASCHQEQFDQATNPDHNSLGLTNDCAMCHTTTPDWMPADFPVHDDYYPLNGAHAVIAMECVECHNGDYINTPNTCFGCHAQDYNSTTDPDHRVLQFSMDCAQCHDEMAWVPSTFDHDQQYFPIYSGEHAGEWAECVDCHTSPGDYSQFTCITCHMNPETDDVHQGVPGYTYNSDACLACHPTGNADDIFDHNMTAFPLTGAHLSADCIACHAGGYRGTPTECEACHTEDFNQTSNPDHQALGLTTDCAMCHTTDPGWMPTEFPVHDDYYELNGAHAVIAMECAECHNGDYNNTPNTCFGCHAEDYNATIDPDHQTLQFGQDCRECHTEDAWLPSTFDHDGQYFPIYSGEHMGEWMECADCHSNLSNYAEVTCTNCHMNPETDDQHVGVPGYIFNDNACLACHPTGSADEIFDHNMTSFPLTGAHTTTDCFECHSGGVFMGTPTECQACHTEDFNQTVNPNHMNLGLSMDCAMCHTTDPGWMPADFPVHDDYYPLNGAHALISMECVECHNGDYNNTPNTCVGCHQADYDATTMPPHEAAQFSTDCASCHTEDAWQPSTFDHDGMHFPINSGTHAGEWMECVDCHNNPANYSDFTCVSCHEHNQMDMDDAHQGVNGYVYLSTACLVCHPNGIADEGFDHNLTNFPLTGGHIGLECLECHAGGYMGTPTECEACHQDDYDMSVNPDHGILGLSTDCAMCHTTDPGWAPADFPVHDDYYQLTGAHATIAMECAECHNGDYVNTPNTCDGCHQSDYDATTNPDHNALGIPTTCDDCHTTDPGWMPATFDIHDQYYPLTGAHATIANECARCHNGDYNNTPNTCDGCHQDDYDATTNPNHVALGLPTACDECHTTEPGWSPATFDIHDNYYVLTGAHATIANECARCHMGDYNNTPTDCDGCHMPDYNASTNPDHNSLGIPTTCDDCHTTDPGWSPATFDIHDNYYPLTGAHVPIASDCNRCHMGDYNNTPNTCDGCHMADYNASTNPNHSALGFPTNCDMCHTTDPGWVPADFPIHDNYYPLTGAHAPIADDCNRCHMGDYNNTPNTCDGCHLSEYNMTTNPNHNAIGIPTDCDMCHTTDPNWMPATFPIHDNYYPLNGAHAAIQNQCDRCHMGDYNNTPNTCYGCHADDYNMTSNPDHSAAGFPTDCEACHTETAWIPATWDHDGMYFPIYSGRHEGEWNQCVDCHTIPGNYTLFSCIDCHEHNDRQQVDEDHDGVGGYSYNSQACYSCHPTGEK